MRALLVLALLAAPAAAADRGLRGTYDPANPFARILRGELPADRVYEDRWTLAFMPLTATARGHVLVIPKQPARTLMDLPPAAWAHVMATVQRVADAQVRALGATGVQINANAGADAGQSVFHLHIHVVPRLAGVPRRTVADESPPDPPAERAAMAARLRVAVRR